MVHTMFGAGSFKTKGIAKEIHHNCHKTKVGQVKVIDKKEVQPTPGEVADGQEDTKLEKWGSLIKSLEHEKPTRKTMTIVE